MVLYKNLENVELFNKKLGKPALHSLTANHMLEMSVKLKLQCVCFERKHCFALTDDFELVSYLFLSKTVQTTQFVSKDSFVLFF